MFFLAKCFERNDIVIDDGNFNEEDMKYSS